MIKPVRQLLYLSFALKENGTTIRREVLAGVTTFITLAYAILLVPSLLSEGGLPFGAVMTATLLTGAFASFLMGVGANYPFVLAPGVAMSAYFTYSLLQEGGSDWQKALGVVFLCGALLLLLNLTGIRQKILLAIPSAIRIGVASGLGLFLALIGLKNAGVIVSHSSTLVALGDPSSPLFILTGVGVLLMASLLAIRSKAAFFIGILALWLLGLLLGYVPYKGILSWPSSLGPTFFKLDIGGVFHLSWLNLFLSFFLVVLFDTSGTLMGLAEQGGFLRSSKKHKGETLPKATRALMPDALGSILGGCLGTTTVALYLESAAGISVGGRTGLTSLIVSVLFLLGLFFTPFASSIPVFATAPVLILVGAMMLRQLSRLQWDEAAEWISGAVTFILIPLTFSVVGGVSVGMILYPLLKFVSGRGREVSLLTWILGLFFLLKFIFFPSL